MVLGFLLAGFAPICWSTSNIVDKYIVSHKVKHIWGYTALTGLITIFFSLALAIWLDWSVMVWSDAIFPIASGILMGLFVCFYLWVLQYEDISTLVGLGYLYPVVVAFLSWVFLGETLSFIGYTGVFFTMLGVGWLAVKNVQFKFRKKLWAIGVIIILLGLWGFLAKVSVTAIPELNAVAISVFAEGVVLFLLLFHPSNRKGFLKETPNTMLATLSELFNDIGFISIFIALSVLPATIVLTIASIQPMTVLVMERAADSLGGKISQQHALLPKLPPILLITIGIALLALTGNG